jgi:hypothetical protein
MICNLPQQSYDAFPKSLEEFKEVNFYICFLIVKQYGVNIAIESRYQNANTAVYGNGCDRS